MATDQQTDSIGAPLIEDAGAKLKVLRRRLTHLNRQLSTWSQDRGGEGFARSEVGALKAAIAALEFHRAQMKGLDTVASALEELIEAVAADGVPGVAPEGLGSAMGRARATLAEWEG